MRIMEYEKKQIATDLPAVTGVNRSRVTLVIEGGAETLT